MNPPPLLRKFFFEPKKAVFSLLLIACLVGFSSDFRLYAYAGSETDDVDLNPLSEMSNLGLDNQYVTADGQAYLAGGPWFGPWSAGTANHNNGFCYNRNCLQSSWITVSARQ